MENIIKKLDILLEKVSYEKDFRQKMIDLFNELLLSKAELIEGLRRREFGDVVNKITNKLEYVSEDELEENHKVIDEVLKILGQ